MPADSKIIAIVGPAFGPDDPGPQVAAAADVDQVVLVLSHLGHPPVIADALQRDRLQPRSLSWRELLFNGGVIVHPGLD